MNPAKRTMIAFCMFATAWTVVCALPHAGRAQTAPPPVSLVDAAAIAQLRSFLSDRVVSISIGAQNREYAGIGQTEIDALDKQWREEREDPDQPLIAETLNSPLSIYLTQIQAQSIGLYSEIFVMDARGLNVGQSAITSDYWQGDEAKYQQTFLIGPDAVFIDEPEFNDDTGTWRIQASMTIADAAARPVGAATVEFNLTELARRAALGLIEPVGETG